MIEINLIHDLDDINYTKYKAAIEWCKEKFGPTPEQREAGVDYRWWSRSRGFDYIFYFLDEHDALLFTLRWA